nr:hypothetical protein CFP56_31546 [Quercus suber]
MEVTIFSLIHHVKHRSGCGPGQGEDHGRFFPLPFRIPRSPGHLRLPRQAMATSRGKRKRAQVSYTTTYDEADNEDLLWETDDDDSEYENYQKSSKRTFTLWKRAKKQKNATATETNSYPAKQVFPFLRLPRELRDMIYEYALSDDPVRLTTKQRAYRTIFLRYYRDAESECHHNRMSPSILAVNKQIHEEGVSFLYKSIFYMADTFTLHRFLTQIGPKNCKFLRWLNIRSLATCDTDTGSGRDMLSAFSLLASCINLETLCINAGYSLRKDMKFVARNIYRKGHCFIEAYGLARGRKDAAVDVIQLEWKSDFLETKSDSSKVELRAEFKAELKRLLKAYGDHSTATYHLRCFRTEDLLVICLAYVTLAVIGSSTLCFHTHFALVTERFQMQSSSDAIQQAPAHRLMSDTIVRSENGTRFGYDELENVEH